jgi:hypothetical protein
MNNMLVIDTNISIWLQAVTYSQYVLWVQPHLGAKENKKLINNFFSIKYFYYNAFSYPTDGQDNEFSNIEYIEYILFQFPRRCL